ncbi:hypothetical protein ACN9JG_18865 (plasmid) [Cereibacter azotoformans]|uniref:hypothetical protein n=1 Tax=Cereibacter azotoformans TaxID=43057 RepID=UPI003B221554
MRQHHVAGERVFVGCAGDIVEIIDGATGEVRAAQIFVGMLGSAPALWGTRGPAHGSLVARTKMLDLGHPRRHHKPTLSGNVAR